MGEYTAIVIAIIGGLFGLASIIYQARRDKHKIDADATTSYEALTSRQARRISEQDAQMDTLKRDYESRLDRLEKLVDEQGREISILYAGLELLTNQLRSEGFTPIWQPKPKKASTQ